MKGVCSLGMLGYLYPGYFGIVHFVPLSEARKGYTRVSWVASVRLHVRCKNEWKETIDFQST